MNEIQESQYIAHVRNMGDIWMTHSIRSHLEGVKELASSFASQFGSEEWAGSAAILHDLGKYSQAFQHKIRVQSGYDTEGHHSADSTKVPHSTHGANWAYSSWGSQIGKILAYLIAGHHGGLPDWHHEIGVGAGLQYRLSSEEVNKLPPIPENIKIPEKDDYPKSIPDIIQHEEQIHLWIRMLYSCLVDADFLDTEAFMSPQMAKSRRSLQDLGHLKNLFDNYMAELSRHSDLSEVNVLRSQILKQCIDKADRKQGIFTLTVPTGGGKTLSSMAFALHHAVKYNKNRIIIVIPYTSIIEQTASVYKRIFGDDNVLEHHSSLDPEKETTESRLASENWDFPIIVTTSVQFFESLFASKPSACRKIHNIVNSIVIFDEAQMLPSDYLKPILQSIKGLADNFFVTPVLCTATQPALTSKLFSRGNGELYSILERNECLEIMESPDPDELSIKLQRVEIELIEPVGSWDVLAERLNQHEQVLCIVNTRNDCRDLFELMPNDTIHLSANMCAAHRSICIDEIKKSLEKCKPVRVISTQLVEAGVDFDFPVVYRAMAGYDSIAQAAGRCNREGRLPEPGRVYIFDAPSTAPAGSLRKGENAGREILSVDPEGCRTLRPETFRKYFELYYASLNSLDKQDIEELLVKHSTAFNFQFRTAASRFNLIDNKRQVSVVIWFDPDEVKKYIEELRYSGPNRFLLRKLQRYTITIPLQVFMEVQGSFEDIHGIYCQNADTLYDSKLGFVGYSGTIGIL